MSNLHFKKPHKNSCFRCGVYRARGFRNGALRSCVKLKKTVKSGFTSCLK